MLTTLTCMFVLTGFGASVSGYIHQKKFMQTRKGVGVPAPRQPKPGKEFKDFLSIVKRKSVGLR